MTRRKIGEERSERIRKRRKKEKVLRLMTIALLCAGIAVQTVLIVRLTGKNKESVRLQNEINQLDSDAINYQLAIGSNGDRKAMKLRAIKELGMVEPTSDQIRVVHVQKDTDNQANDTQLVMNTQVD